MVPIEVTVRATPDGPGIQQVSEAIADLGRWHAAVSHVFVDQASPGQDGNDTVRAVVFVRVPHRDLGQTVCRDALTALGRDGQRGFEVVRIVPCPELPSVRTRPPARP